VHVTWVPELQVRDMEDGSATWIAKPSLTNQATGICIFNRCSDLRSALEASEDLREWVLQRYGAP
jgi:Tubulin-tyrosine ligase family